MDSTPSHLELARRYLTALERGDCESVAALLHPAIEQIEYPNTLNPGGQVRDWNGLLQDVVRGRQIMAAQRFEIVNAIEAGDQVALEVIYTGEVAADVGPVKGGTILRVRFAAFLRFENRQILSQRNYHCVELL
jgi:ketosteroid isomerase-like protein